MVSSKICLVRLRRYRWPVAAQCILALTMPLLGQGVPDDVSEHVHAAQVAESQDDFATAVKEYDLVARQMPGNAEMQSNLGVALYFDHQTERAIVALKKAEQLKPTLFAPHLFLGLSLYRGGNPDAAAVQLKRAVQLNANDALGHTWLGYTYVAQSHYDSAAQEFGIAGKLKPDDIDVGYAMGQCYLELGKQAIAQLLARAPDGGRTWQLAAEQYELRGDNKKALELYRGALQKRPDLEEVRAKVVKLGGSAEDSAVSTAGANHAQEDALYVEAHRDEANARAAFARVLELDPNSYRAHQIQGDAFVAQQRWKQAETEYRAVASTKPDLPGIHGAIGECLLRQGNLPDALQEYQAELRLQPRAASANVDVGRLLTLLGRDSEAAKVLENALHLDRPPAETYKLLGKIEVRSEHYPQAEAHLSRYLAMQPADSNAYYLLAQAYRAMGNKAESELAVAKYKQYSQDEMQRSSARKALERLNEHTDRDNTPATTP